VFDLLGLIILNNLSICFNCWGDAVAYVVGITHIVFSVHGGWGIEPNYNIYGQCRLSLKYPIPLF
jgi:amino acid permease